MNKNPLQDTATLDDYRAADGSPASTANQAIVRRLVDREVVYCVSSLVYELTQQAEHFPDYADDLADAWRGLPDYDEAATEAGWESFTDEHGAACWRDTEDGQTWAGSAEDVCREFDIDANDHEPEVFEHWIVSDFLADRLEANGQRVLRDFFGFTIWGRTTSGQAILLDHVIQQIAAEMQILVGQRNDWSE